MAKVSPWFLAIRHLRCAHSDMVARCQGLVLGYEGVTSHEEGAQGQGRDPVMSRESEELPAVTEGSGASESAARRELSGLEADSHFCLIKRFRRTWQWLSRQSTVGVLGVVSSWLALAVAPSVVLLRRQGFRRHEGCVAAPVASAGGAAGVVLVVAVVWILISHFKQDTAPWSDWQGRRICLGLSLPAATSSLALALAAWFPLASLVYPWVLLLVANVPIWVLIDREAQQHADPPPAPRVGRPFGEVSSPTLLAFAVFLVAFAGGSVVTTTAPPPPIQKPAPEPTPPETPPKTPQSSNPQSTPSTGRKGRLACEHVPGEGAPPPVAEKMAAASSPAAAKRQDWGCLSVVANNSDGSSVQRFELASAFLIGSELGAGIVGDSYADVLRAQVGERLTTEALGGLPLNRIDCADERADFQALVGDDGKVQRLFGRARKSRRSENGTVHSFQPFEVAPELFAAFNQHVRGGRVLAPDGPARMNIDGRVSQEFVDPSRTDLTEKIVLQGNLGSLPQDFTAAVLHEGCSPGASVPAFLRPGRE